MIHSYLTGNRARYAAAGALLVAGSSLGLAAHFAGSETSTDEDGVTVTYASQGRVGTTAEGLTYAPRPIVEFRAQACALSPQAPTLLPTTDQLTVPSLDVEVPVGTSSNLSELPEAPRVVRFDESPTLDASEGTTVIAGHVDYPRETTDPGTNKLSPFGQLHTASPCAHVYVADAEDQQHEYVITDMYTVPQDQIEATGIYTATGDPRLVLVTCSGPAVGDGQGDDLFAYRYNLIVEAIPVEAAS